MSQDFDTQHPRGRVGTFVNRIQSAPELSLKVYVSAVELEEWLRRNRCHLPEDAATALLHRINAGADDTDLSRTDLYREVFEEVNGYTVQDFAAYEKALAQLEANGLEGARDHIEVLVAKLSVAQSFARAPLPERARDGGSSTPISVNDPRVQAGQAPDSVVAADGTVFHRLGGEFNVPMDASQMRIVASRELSDAELDQFRELIDYAYCTGARARPNLTGWPVRDSPFSFTIATPPRNDDRPHGTDLLAYSHLVDYVDEGTPVRLTDQAGPGTAGTSLANGLPDIADFETYYDRYSH